MKPIYEEYLKDYQRDGIDKIKETDGNIILADEPGLGKTIQTLAYLYEAKKFPVLIVCPASLKLNWQQEIKKWLDFDDVYICHGTRDVEKKSKEAALKKVVIINYDILINWAYELYWNCFFEAIVFDEAHMIKENKDANIMRPIKKHRISCTSETDRVSAANYLAQMIRSKIFITGTPVVNGVADIANFLLWIDPCLFGGYKNFLEKFTEEYYNPRIKKIEYLGGRNLLELNEILNNGYIVRRKKLTATPDLPNKNRVFIPIKCDFYANLGKRVPINKIQKERVARTEYILNTVISWIKDFLETDKKLVIFCNFTATIDALKEKFKDKAVIFDGRCSEIEKDNAVKEFQCNPEKKLFVGNLQAASVGITLTAADTVLTIDFSHTVKDHYQAEDRVCRIGQKSDSVTVYYIYVPNSVDEQMIDNLNAKAEVAKGAVDGEGVVSADLFERDSYMRHYTYEEKTVIEKQRLKEGLKSLTLLFLLSIIAGLTFFIFFDVLDFYKNDNEEK